MRISNITHKKYNEEDTKDLFNSFQAGLYCKFGCKLVDWYWLEEETTLVHVVAKDEVFRKVHNLWCLKKLKNMTLEEFERWE